MRANALNLHVYPVRIEITVTKQIPILHIFSTDKSKSEEFLLDKSSYPKYNLGTSGQGLITFLGIMSNTRPNKYKMKSTPS